MRQAAALAGNFNRAIVCALAVATIAGSSPVHAVVTGGWADWEGNTNYTVTGGSGGTTTTVTTVSAFTTAVGSASPMVVLFSNSLNVGAFNGIRLNKTIIGLGTNATLIGDVQLFRTTNVIVRNVFFTNPSEVGDGDAITMQRSTHIWIDHCTFHDTGDGALDMTHACDYVTASYLKFFYTSDTGHNFVNLVGHTDNNCAEDCGKLKITFHHNWWSTLCIERMPRVRYGKIHSYNNYFNAPGNNYCIRASISSEVFAVKNVFDNINSPYQYFESSSGTGNQIGKILAVSNATINCTGVSSFNDTVFTPPYPYSMDETNLVAGLVTNNAGAGRVPVAIFTGTPTNGAAPLTVTFTNQSTGLLTNNFWTFGDSSSTNTTNSIVSHTYSDGTYTVTMTAGGWAGTNTTTKANYIVAGSLSPPVASFTASPTNGAVPLAVTFTDTSTGSITSNFWDFGDGGTTNFTAPTNVSHTYVTTGAYSVILIATGPGGAGTNTQLNLITAAPPPPVAGFTASPTNGVEPLAVTFTDTSTGSSPLSLSWDLGDSFTTNTAGGASFGHTYAAGTYTVTLIASNSAGTSTLVSNNLIAVITPFQAWQLQFFGCTNCPQAQGDADADGDGMSNTNELLAGTTPTNNLSALRIISTAQQGGDMEVSWTTAGAHTNAVQASVGDVDGSYSNNFEDITTPPHIIIGGSGDATTNYLDTGGATNIPSRFYRIRLVP